MARRRPRRRRGRGRRLVALTVMTAAALAAIWFLSRAARSSSRVTFRLPTPAPVAPNASAEGITDVDRQRLEEALRRGRASDPHGSSSNR